MTIEHFQSILQQVATESWQLVEKHLVANELDGEIDYVAIFPESEAEFLLLNTVIHSLGTVVKEQASGDVILFTAPFQTSVGPVKMGRVRKFDPTRKERGYADYGMRNYAECKKKYLGKPGFLLIKGLDFEMIELIDPAFNVRVYFPDTPLGKDLGVR